MNVEIKIIYYLIYFSVSINIIGLIIHYLKIKQDIFLDGFFYVILLSNIYIAYPSLVHLSTGLTLTKAAYSTIHFVAGYSAYFLSIISIFYLIYVLKKRRIIKMFIPKIIQIDNKIIYVFYSLIILVLIFIYAIEIHGRIQIFSNRGLGSFLYTNINNKYKLTFLYYIVISFTTYLSIKNKSIKYLLLLVPFAIFELILSGRTYAYMMLMASIIIFRVLGKKIPILSLFLFSFFLLAISAIRGGDAISLDSIDGEVLLTFETVYLVFESNSFIETWRMVLYSITKMFSTMLAQMFFGDAFFGKIVTQENPLHFGLGGSLLTEVFSTNSLLLRYLYPFLIILYSLIINKLLRKRTFAGLLFFVFFVSGSHRMFRSGLITFSFEPIYYIIFAASWYWYFRYVYVR